MWIKKGGISILEAHSARLLSFSYIILVNDYDDECHFEQVARNNMVQDDDFKEEFTYDINNNIDSKVKLERKDYQEDDQIDQAAYQDDDQIIFM